jgi:hypothetical protein
MRERVLAGPALPLRLLQAVPGGFVALWVLPGVMACGGSSTPDARQGAGFSQVDSAGVLLSITSGEKASAPLGWTVASEPDLVLGGHESDYFHQIQGLQRTPDGGVLVVDGGSGELRFYDPEGRLVKRAGGRGRGPGEFVDPVLVPVAGTDSVFVYDRELIRAHVLSSEGELGRLIHYRLGRPYGGRAPVGAAGFRHLLFNASGSAEGPEAPRPTEGMYQLMQVFLWYDTATGNRSTIDSVVVDSRYYDQGLDWVVPFIPRSAAAATAEAAFLTRGRDPEILEFDVDGQLRRVFRIEDFGRPVSQTMIDAFIDLEHARRPARYGPLDRRAWYRVYEDIGIPDTLPAFQDLRIDELGWLWAEVCDFDASRAREWVVFDPEGRAHGTVRTPPGSGGQVDRTR